MAPKILFEFAVLSINYCCDVLFAGIYFLNRIKRIETRFGQSFRYKGSIWIFKRFKDLWKDNKIILRILPFYVSNFSKTINFKEIETKDKNLVNGIKLQGFLS